MLEFFYLPPEVGISEANDLVFTAAWVAAKGDETGNPLFSQPAFRKQMYSWSETESFGTASLVNFRLYSEFDRSVSKMSELGWIGCWMRHIGCFFAQGCIFRSNTSSL
jgi:hypothetical protein